MRCDGQRPTCRNCKQRSNPCIYVQEQKRRGPGKAPRGSRKSARGRLRSKEPPQGQASNASQVQPLSPEHSQSNIFVNQFIASSESQMNTAAPSTSGALLPPPPPHVASPLESPSRQGSGIASGHTRTTSDREYSNTEQSSENVTPVKEVGNSSEEMYKGMMEFVHEDYHATSPNPSSSANANTNPDPP